MQEIKTAFCAFASNYIDVNDKKISIDGKRLKRLKEQKKKITF